MRKKFWFTLIGIVILTALAGVVDYPSGPDIKIGNYFRELKVHLGLDLKGGAQLVYTADMKDVPAADQQQALEGARDVIEQRVNAFGVSEPLVQTNQSGDSSRIIVELPGVTDIDQAIKQIGETPLLEFREQKQQTLTDEQKKALEIYNAAQKQKAEEALAKAVQPGADFAALANEYSEDPGNTGTDGTKSGGDLGFVREGAFVPEFDEQLFTVLKPGEITPALVETQFGYHIIKKEEERMVDDNGTQVKEVRARHILLAIQSESNLEQAQFAATDLTGKQLERSQVAFDQQTGAPYILLQFNDEGSKLFEQITERNVGKPIAIYLDGFPISSPVVSEKIVGGQASIEGSFTLDEARQLVRRLNAGALPVPISLVSQQTVGATLGQESIDRSLFAGLLGLAVVALFMIAYYRFPGFIAVVALCIYALLVLAVFKLLPVTLTLAGVAGFILSIGMAVDANILIFERTKEEIRLGKPLAVAIEEGFKRAWLSIRDSNASSLITVFFLGWLGTSIIKGFAITLGIGILISMFTAITMTRTFMRLVAGGWLEKRSWLFGVSKKDILPSPHV
ncbi:MAG: protein translocase subunit SecD [Patescibacteria group bacterium]|jgi:preprotein translocase subunit SecD